MPSPVAAESNAADHIAAEDKALDKVRLKEILMSRTLDKAEERYDAYDEATKRRLCMELLKQCKVNQRLPDTDRRLAYSSGCVADKKYSADYTGGGEYYMGSIEESEKRTAISPAELLRHAKPGQIDISADPYIVKAFFRNHWPYEYDQEQQEEPIMLEPVYERVGMFRHFSEQECCERRTISADGSFISKVMERSKIFGELKPVDERLAPTLEPNDMVCWNNEELYKTSPTSGFQYCGANSQPGFRTDVFEFCQLSRRISTQLMLYRLTVVFGMPPSRDDLDDHKQVWKVTLYWKDNPHFYLEFVDMKGQCQVDFEGNGEANESALRLLDWLVSDNVDHPYNYTEAGNVA